MENLFTVNEVKLSYKTKQKVSERPKVLSSESVYKVLLNCYDADTNASGVILSHNHPSGNIQSSKDDDMITNKIKSACELMNINVLDHIIITSESYYSYADEGRI